MKTVLDIAELWDIAASTRVGKSIDLPKIEELKPVNVQFKINGKHVILQWRDYAGLHIVNTTRHGKRITAYVTIPNGAPLLPIPVKKRRKRLKK